MAPPISQFDVFLEFQQCSCEFAFDHHLVLLFWLSFFVQLQVSFSMHQ